MWPIPGPDLKTSALNFFEHTLKLANVSDMNSLSVQRYQTARSRITDEVLVVFPTSDARDDVKAAASHLSGLNAGMRSHIPVNLKANFHHLESVRFSLKKKFPGLKRSIKFDDDLMDLSLIHI